MSNLKQLGLAVMMYVNDNDGWLPPAYDDAGGCGTWIAHLDNGGYAKIPVFDDPPYAYGKSGIAVCPSSKYRYEKCLTNYAYSVQCGVISAGTVYDPRRKLCRVPMPSNASLLTDATLLSSKCTGSFPYYSNYIFYGSGDIRWDLHSGGANILFVDGHVSFVKESDKSNLAYDW